MFGPGVSLSLLRTGEWQGTNLSLENLSGLQAEGFHVLFGERLALKKLLEPGLLSRVIGESFGHRALFRIQMNELKREGRGGE